VDLGYAALAGRYTELREEINYSDEELAMLSFYPYFRYAHDAGMLTGIDQWWENCQRENNPLWTYIYSMARPNAPVDLAAARATLERIPMDLIEWTVANSSRVPMIKELDRAQLRQSKNLLPPDERPVMKWNGNPFVVDGGNQGRSEDDGGFYLLAYWMGRYFGFVV
jgi:hypothetical protein